jgi:hypothetical protein
LNKIGPDPDTSVKPEGEGQGWETSPKGKQEELKGITQSRGTRVIVNRVRESVKAPTQRDKTLRHILALRSARPPDLE